MRLWRSTLFLLLISPWPQGQDKDQGHGGVTAQLYTVLEDVAEAYDNSTFPLSFIPSDSTTPFEKVTYRRRTCMVPFQDEQTDANPHQADEWAHYRGHWHTQHHYFCSNIPRFQDVFKLGLQGPMGDPVGGDRLQSPHARFWMGDPSSWSWQGHQVPQGLPQGWKYQAAKDLGLIFRIDVTGIESKGRFLKGWYHLKITLDIDHNIKNKDPSFINDTREDYYIDKLMVTARGRTLVPGRPRKNSATRHQKVLRPPRRAWVGGIGEFVQDFPQCRDTPRMQYVPQQFMPCGTVQYAESKHGNNFYFSRGETRYVDEYKEDAKKYGGNNKDIHLNFRLDNSFCNRYYDLDFVATGIARSRSKWVKVQIQAPVPTQDWVPWWRCLQAECLGQPPLPPGVLQPQELRVPETHPILRSISTRFTFISSHTHHHPDYYENADPVPRHGDRVTCTKPLKGEWGMASPSIKSPHHTRDKHQMSITKGADLVLSGARPDSTFYGALKFVLPVPSNLSTLFDPDGRPSGNDTSTFNSRRTWTYSARLYKWPLKGPEWSPWRAWDDKEALPRIHQDSWPSEVPHMVAAIQRVLNEMDWETSIERYLATGSTALDCPYGRSNIYPNGEEDGATLWPHYYYDVTCGGVDVKGVSRPAGQGEKLSWWNHPAYINPFKVKEYQPPYEYYANNPFHAQFPPITGRCVGSLWFNDGIGHTYIPPPYCNEFFRESKLWTEHTGDGNKVFDPSASFDPALAKVVEGVERQRRSRSRSEWDKVYLQDHTLEFHKAYCEWSDTLSEEFPGCIRIVPQPYTPRPPKDHEENKWDAYHREEFKQTNAYRRGMLVSESPYTLYIWDSRLIHGCFMTIITMFVTPVSIFVTRYYKETFMDTRVLLHRVWYFVHIVFSLLTQLLFMVGLWRQAKSHALLGVSLGGNGKVHRLVGWAAVTLSALLFFFGGLRTLNRQLRAFLIIMHWAAGFVFYAMCLVCMLTSIGIPGSPGAYHDYTTNNFHTTNLTQEAVFMTVVIWIVFDIVMHITMTLLQCSNDSKMELTEPRYCFLSIIPVLPENFRFDTPGRFPRIYLLWLYVIVAFIGTVTIITFMINYSPRGRGLGFMSCTHTSVKDGLNVRMTYGCS